MLAIIRIILVTFICFWIGIIGIVYSLFKPANPNNVNFISQKLLRYLAPLIGLKVEYRYQNLDFSRHYIYICNHQSNYDLISLPGMIMPRTVGVGKKALKWIPIFGLLFWITGNVFIDRKNSVKAKGLLEQLKEKIKQKNISIWMFPEGTRSKGRGLLPFKMGAFYLAIDSNSPIVPIVSSNIEIKLNRWNNGKVIVEMLPPIETSEFNKNDAKKLANHSHQLMAKKLQDLNQEVANSKQ